MNLVSMTNVHKNYNLHLNSELPLTIIKSPQISSNHPWKTFLLLLLLLLYVITIIIVDKCHSQEKTNSLPTCKHSS